MFLDAPVACAAMQLADLREDVAAACRRLAADGLVHATAGNVSARDGDLIAITPTGVRLEELRAEEVAVVDRSGAQVDGALAPTSELELHLGVVAGAAAGDVSDVRAVPVNHFGNPEKNSWLIASRYQQRQRFRSGLFCQ